MGDRTSSERKQPSGLVGFLRRLVKEKPLGTVGLVIVLLLLFFGIFANYLAPYGMNQTNVVDRLAPPSAQYLMGTDNLGRDILSRVIYGARISLNVGLSATAVSLIVFLTIGILSGYIGGKFDLIVQRFVDSIMSIPGLILLMVIMSIVGVGFGPIIIVVGILMGIGGSRIIRGAVISIKEEVYVQAAIAIGCPTHRVLLRHILPNISALAVTLFSIQVPEAILIESTLSFLGLGIPPPDPSWGGMISGSARSWMIKAPWMVIWPGLVLSIVVYGTNMFGDAVRDLLDPKLKGGIGRYGVKIKKFSKSKA
jgi:peptide/nickel transport system permease protein